MKFLPFENITYSTQLDSSECLNRISGIFANNNYESYEGNIYGKEFIIYRRIRYRNSFLPRIKGVIEKDLDGTKIKVKMKLHPLMLTFICFFLVVIGVICISVLTSITGKEYYESINLIHFAMLIFAYGLTMGGFKYESIKSKKYLAQIFEAKIVA